MAFAFFCVIDPEKLDLFSRHRAEHYRFLIANKDKILFGGPTRNTDGAPETMIIIAQLADVAEAERFIASEPYNRHGGFKSVTIRPWSQVLPETEPDALQKTLDAELNKH